MRIYFFFFILHFSLQKADFSRQIQLVFMGIFFKLFNFVLQFLNRFFKFKYHNYTTSSCIFKMVPTYRFMFTLLTTSSSCPYLIKNSAVSKSSCSFSLIVSSITRRPAKPIKAPFSARLISPTDANDADTPPVVGFVM